MKALNILVLSSIAIQLVACSSEQVNHQTQVDTKVVTEEDLIREAEEIINSDEETYWDFSDPKNSDEEKDN